MTGDLAQTLQARLAQFPTFLHANGFAVGAGAGIESLQVALHSGLLERDLLRWSLRSLLCGRADEWRRFDRLFDAWFLPANRWQQAVKRDSQKGFLSGEQPHGPVSERQLGEDLEEIRPRQAASLQESQRKADFRELMQREHLLEVEALVRRFARQLRYIRQRRMASSQRGRMLDMPRTIRRSVASGGTPIDLRYRDRKRVRPRLVLLIDVSRSMVQHSFFYLRLARALGAEMPDVHSYIFHTHMTGVSQALHDPDPARAQERLHVLADGWAGGTRIGDSLAQFNRDHAPRVVNSRTSVLIFSDGYDTGEAAGLARALAHLRRRARRVVWLNPLLNQPGFEPVSQAMTAAMPHLDLLAAAGDLASLRSVLPTLIESMH
ncbi:MAG: VWA domain-containing protein [Quisquiliibacterium sp.]